VGGDIRVFVGPLGLGRREACCFEIPCAEIYACAWIRSARR